MENENSSTLLTPSSVPEIEDTVRTDNPDALKSGILRRAGLYLATVILAAAVIFVTLLIQRILIDITFHEKKSGLSYDENKISQVRDKLTKDIKALDSRLARKIPSSYYMVINTSSNVFSLYRGTSLVRTDKCSTGSYILLKNGDAQSWMFKTPRGEFRIQGKVTSPVWHKPDWAFIEEGLPVPPENDASRYERGVLGDYALSLGDGYMIHGTLYQRFLGLPVTHGCIRLNDENLEIVYNSLQTGSKVFIY